MSNVKSPSMAQSPWGKNSPVLPLMRYLDWTSCAFPVWISAALNASTISFSPSTESFCNNRFTETDSQKLSIHAIWKQLQNSSNQTKQSHPINMIDQSINQLTSKSINSIKPSTSWCKIEATERECHKECLTAYNQSHNKSAKLKWTRGLQDYSQKYAMNQNVKRVQMKYLQKLNPIFDHTLRYQLSLCNLRFPFTLLCFTGFIIFNLKCCNKHKWMHAIESKQTVQNCNKNQCSR